MKLLITGATGFIGTHLCARLSKKYELVALVRHSTDTNDLVKKNIKPLIFDGDVDALTATLSNEKIEGIVHLASLYLKAHQSKDISALIESNVLFPTQLLEAATRSSVPWLVNTGTFWQHYGGAQYSPVNLYAATKQSFIDIAKYYQETTQTKIVTLKLSDTFGPGDTRPKIFNLWQKNAQTKEVLEMSAGEQIIDISYIDNVIDAFEALVTQLITKPESLKDEYAVSHNEKLTLRELSALFEKISNKKLYIHWGAVPYRDREIMVPWSKGVPVPGWKPKISLEVGIKYLCKDLYDKC
jgi:CDP-paratose synthetase